VPPLAAVPDLEAELDALYSLPLGEFTSARNDLVARLRRAHQAEAAETVKALKKPSSVAWAANHLARTAPDQVASLLEASRRLRDTQQRALEGDASAGDVSAATDAERTAVRILVTTARQELGGRATPTLLDRLGRTLRAAAVDDLGRQLLTRGRLTAELSAVGFGPLEAVEQARPRADELARAARERVTTLRAAARQLAGEARTADKAAREAEQAAEMLRTEASHKRSEADHAARELAEAEAALRSRP
jgi:hypothetical protein